MHHHEPAPVSSGQAQQVKAAWPELLATLTAAATQALQRRGRSQDEASELATIVMLSLAEYAGGRVIYLPRGDAIKRALRNNQLVEQWRAGATPAALAQHFRMSDKQVYQIIRDARAKRRIEQPPPGTRA